MSKRLLQDSIEKRTGKISGKITGTITGHLVTYFISIAMTIWSGESPRILLYAHGFSVFFRLIAVWMVALLVEKFGSKGRIGALFSREPIKGERSRPWNDSRTQKPAGIVSYIVVILTLYFMVGIVLFMGSGPGFLSRKIMIPEMSWALFIGLIYLVEDLISKQLVVSSSESIPKNLGYNVGGLNFLMAAVFISAFVLVLTMNIAVWLFNSHHYVIIVEWLILLSLSTIRLIYDISGERKKSKPVN